MQGYLFICVYFKSNDYLFPFVPSELATFIVITKKIGII